MKKMPSHTPSLSISNTRTGLKKRWAVSLFILTVSLLALPITLPPVSRSAPQPVQSSCISLAAAGVAYTQDFNILASTGTSSTLPAGWAFSESGTNANTTYTAGTGSSTTGDTYSFGASGNTDRAFGGLQSGSLIPTIGACFTNNTGVTITSLAISYTGEQWRIGNTSTARDDRIDFQYSLDATSLTTGTWTDVNALDFTNLIKTATTAGALDGNNAANRTAITNTISGLSIANGTTFFIRWTDFNAAGADDGLAVDDFSLTPNPGGGTTVSINDVTMAEGDSGTTTFTFTVSLSSPAGAGGVTFDIATADNTATTANNDYVAKSLTAQTIPSGSSTYTFDVTVNGDTTVEPNETFFVNVTNITGATAGDIQGTGTITNDDVTLTSIHDIQGNGASSPLVGNVVSTRGIVTGIKSNGFFIQEPDATVDADPATSEGVFVFTSSAPPAAAAVGNLVQVTATVSEFVPSADPLQPPLTELTSPAVSLISTGNPLPAAISLTATFPDPAGAFDQLERLEGMRVSVASLTVVGPTQGSTDEVNASGSSNGVFYGVVTGVARPFREPGIQAPDPAPSGAIPPIPRFDSNPERIRVDSDGQTGATAIDVGAGAVVTGLVGPLDYAFRTYTILPDPASPPMASGGPVPLAVTAPLGTEFTVASFNMERFFDNVNDPAIGEPVLTTTAFNKRLAKASLAIRNYLLSPDIIGIEEMENLSTLQALAAQISSDALAAMQPDPMYAAYLVEGNDVGGIDVGFLVKTAPVAGSTPRVTVNAIVQELKNTLFVNPDSSTELLNDRPPLRLMAVINHPNGASFPVTVIVNHLRSLNDVGSNAAGSNGWATLGERVRAKRQKQAEDLANLVQARQIADPSERIILVGDFNAFEFNDGFVHSMGVIAGTPAPDNETAVPGDGVDLVNPDLVNLFDTPPPSERYSFVFDGNAQSLDHALVNSALIASTVARRIEHARIDADFPETARSSAITPARLSDHDPLVAYFQVASFATANISITKMDGTDPVIAGANETYTITVTNNGPDAAENVSLSDTLPAGTSFVSFSAPAGWTSTTPAVGAGGTVTSSIASLPVGSAVFTLTVNIDPSVANDTVISNTATVTSTTADTNANDNSSMATTTVTQKADLAVIKSDSPDPACVNGNITYTINFANNGLGPALNASVTDTVPANTTFISAAVMSGTGWTTTSPAVGGTGNVTFSKSSVGIGETATFQMVVKVNAGTTAGTVINNSATASTTSPEANAANDTGTATTTVDNIKPAFGSCPNVTARTANPNDTSVAVNYATPTATDNCAVASVVCNPPSGSVFAVGQTNVTCTATDTAGNMATCTFKVTVFDVCLQDDTNPNNVILFNSFTGDYVLCCGTFKASGRGVVNKHAAIIKLQDDATDRRLNVEISLPQRIGVASLQMPPGTRRCIITDRNYSNNSCNCSAP